MDPAVREKVERLRQQHNDGLIVGLKDVSGVVNRQDIDVLLFNDPKVFNLLLLALKELQETPSTDIMGYFQIAGIHGYPKQLWNGVLGKDMSKFDGGYCAHGVTKFATWHRPYMVMLEQALFLSMIAIAERYTDPQVQADYYNAALRFRLPYWDYFRPRGGPVTFPGIIDRGSRTSFQYDYKAPAIFTQQKVMVRMYPNDDLQELERNPFNFFDFTTASGTLAEADWKFLNSDRDTVVDSNRTNRHPTRSTFDNSDRLNKTLNELRMDANRYALDMIGEDYYKSFDSFCSAARIGGGKPNQSFRPPPDSQHANAQTMAFQNSGSLEALHNMYHGLCGGTSLGGHMSRVAVAAFDPLFWYHHNQIERLFTIWQKVHEDEPQTNWFDRDPHPAKDDLVPFQRPVNAEGERFWKSDSSAHSEAFGYSYDDVKATPAETRSNFEALYRWSVPRTLADPIGTPPDSMKWLDVLNTEFFKTGGNSLVSSVVGAAKEFVPSALTMRSPVSVPPLMNTIVVPIGEEGTTTSTADDAWEWFIDDEVKRMALNGSFSILFFINYEAGQSLDDGQDLGVAPTLAGLTYIFAAPREGCDNCGRQAEQALVVRDTSPITSQLLDYVKIGHLESMRPEHVKPFLIDRLRWRVVNVNGERVNPRVMARDHSLRIGISAKMTRGNASPEVSTYDDIIESIIGHAA